MLAPRQSTAAPALRLCERPLDLRPQPRGRLQGSFTYLCSTHRLVPGLVARRGPAGGPRAAARAAATSSPRRPDAASLRRTPIAGRMPLLELPPVHARAPVHDRRFPYVVSLEQLDLDPSSLQSRDLRTSARAGGRNPSMGGRLKTAPSSRGVCPRRYVRIAARRPKTSLRCAH